MSASPGRNDAASPVEEGDAPRASRVFASKPVLAVVTLLVLSAAAQLVPQLARLRVFTPHAARTPEPTPVPAPSTAVGETELERATENRADLAQPERLEAPPAPRGPIARDPAETKENKETDASPVPIVDPTGSLEKLFAVLRRAERREPSAVAHIVFFGDSVVASDFGTATLRRLLAARFGDAGHGFVLVANAWPQYFHNDVYRVADKGFRVSRVVGPRADDRLYGLGGVSFVASPGLRSRIGTAKDGDFGRSVSRFDLAYVAGPQGGSLEVSIDGEKTRVIDTADATKHAAFAELRVPDGPHELELLVRGGPVRLFGVALERDTPGTVLDAIGIVGARIRTLLEIDPANFAEALAWRRPNLLVFQFGANESGDGFAYPMPEYHRTMKEVIARMQEAVPAAGCLVVGAMDRARKENDHLVTVPIIPHIVEEQRKVSSELGCAYWSAYEAMGGRNSMARWVVKGFGAGDFTHPTRWGADELGKWIYSALMSRYAASPTPAPSASP